MAIANNPLGTLAVLFVLFLVLICLRPVQEFLGFIGRNFGKLLAVAIVAGIIAALIIFG